MPNHDLERQKPFGSKESVDLPSAVDVDSRASTAVDSDTTCAGRIYYPLAQSLCSMKRLIRAYFEARRIQAADRKQENDEINVTTTVSC